MKHISIIFIALLFAGCNHSQGDIEFTGIATGIDFGNVVIKDYSNTNTIYRTDIEAGKFNISKRFLQYSGYYNLSYSSNSGPSRHVEIYLQPGSYTINIDSKSINNYPLITSTSKIQNELSAYNAVNDSINNEKRQNVVALNNQIQGLGDQALTPGQYVTRSNKLQSEEMEANQVDELGVFDVFMKKYPENEIAPHLMIKMDYQSDPAGYYKLYHKFSADAKNTDEGKALGSKLEQLARLSAGGSAPGLAGTTPDGKEVAIKALNKKIILLDFWRSGNAMSRDNHKQMITDLFAKFGSNGFGIISISFDTEREKWLSAINDDKMNWPQISDLKGDDSPNVENWGIKDIPVYYLLDGQGHIIAHITEFDDVVPVITKYLQSHP